MLLFTFLLLTLLEIAPIGAVSLCNNDHSVDCSTEWRIPDLPERSCEIHPTIICQNMTFSATPALTTLKSEDNAPFEISVNTFETGEVDYSYALNVSLSTDNKDITGFVFLLQQKLPEKYNSCRVFDFQGVKRLYPEQKVNLNYECYRGFSISTSRNYVLIIRALPINQEFYYKIYIPTLQQTEARSICSWGPTVLINMEAFYDQTFDLKFSSISSSHRVDDYSVILVSSKNRFVKTVSKLLDAEAKMHRVLFSNLPNGVYNLSVVANSGKVNCSSPAVLISLDISQPDPPPFPWYLLLGAVIVTAAMVAGVWLPFKYCVVKSLLRPDILMLYSDDHAKHMEVVLKFFEFLKQCCSVNVKIDKWHLGNQAPEDWISENICQAKIIVFIISKGVHHKVHNKNSPKMIENTPWGDLFFPSYRYLKRHIIFAKNCPEILNVVFTPYCDKSLVPKKLKSIGKTFCLMEDFNSFLLHIHSQKTRWCFPKYCPVMPGSRYLKFAEGEELQRALEDMKLFEKSSPDWFATQLSKDTDEDNFETRKASCSGESTSPSEDGIPEEIGLIPRRSQTC